MVQNIVFRERTGYEAQQTSKEETELRCQDISVLQAQFPRPQHNHRNSLQRSFHDWNNRETRLPLQMFVF